MVWHEPFFFLSLRPLAPETGKLASTSRNLSDITAANSLNSCWVTGNSDAGAPSQKRSHGRADVDVVVANHR